MSASPRSSRHERRLAGNQCTKAATGARMATPQPAGDRRPTFVPIHPVRVLSSRDGIGPTGVQRKRCAKHHDRQRHPGRRGRDHRQPHGDRADAAGFLAVTPTLNNTPSTSTLNFLLGDNRANNIISPLSTTGSVSIVYKAIAGKSTHVSSTSPATTRTPRRFDLQDRHPCRSLDTPRRHRRADRQVPARASEVGRCVAPMGSWTSPASPRSPEPDVTVRTRVALQRWARLSHRTRRPPR